jgi:hypothetical protein
MLVSIHLVARLLRMPILRIDGDIHLRDEPRRLRPAEPRRLPPADVPAGGLLGLAMADLEHAERLDRARRNGSGG